MGWQMTAVIATALLGSVAEGRGVSPYLPLNQSPEIERQIEKLLLLADRPIMKRPIAAATVWDALPAACDKDSVLCRQVREYLASYMRNSGVTHASLAGAVTSGKPTSLPNRHGMNTDSAFEASVLAYWQNSDYFILSTGVLGYEDEITPTGSMVSIGYEYAQLDIGYRDHWFSPMTDSARLVSVQAETMPSITLSNFTPLTRWGFHYEVFAAEMSVSDKIAFEGRLISGKPRLVGLNLSIEPVTGWSLGVNRLMQLGGGERATSSEDFFGAMFRPSKYDNTGTDEDTGNQLVAITSRFLSQGAVPFSVYFEYAAEDTSFADNFRLGNVGLSGGIYFPTLWQDFELTVEVSEWQNGWYTHHIYQDGLRHENHVIGHWGGDWRELGDSIGGQSVMAQIGWPVTFGGLLETTYRTLGNESYSTLDYGRAHALEVLYSRSWSNFLVGGELNLGRDVFGKSYSRVSAFIRF